MLDALEVDQTNVQNHEADPDQINDDLNRQRNLDHDPDQSKLLYMNHMIVQNYNKNF